MPEERAVKEVPFLSSLATQVITAQRAVEDDFVFFQDINTVASCPEYNGYNTNQCREAGLQPQPKTKVSFLPLIDRSLLTMAPPELP